MLYKENWQETQERFVAWWNGDKMDRPLMRIVAHRDNPLEELEPVSEPTLPEELYLDVDSAVKRFRNYCRTHTFLADAFPAIDLNLGAGSMALYLGSKPTFRWDTVWFEECIKDYDEWGSMQYDPDNHWWKEHQSIISRAQELAGGGFLINIPDIVEGLDILSAMRGPQNLCLDLIDYPEHVSRCVQELDDLYFAFYDPMYELVKDANGGSSFTAFSIWGPGKTAKVQCDFAALISPAHFRELAQPSLRQQCQQLDYSLFHLDGPDAIRHVDALMEIDELNALQWTAGAGQPDGGNERWYPIYDKVKDAGKSLWIEIHDGDLTDWVATADRLVKRYGVDGLYLLFPDMEAQEAKELMLIANRRWSR